MSNTFQENMSRFAKSLREKQEELAERDRNLDTGPAKNFTLEGYELHLFEEWYADHVQKCPLRDTGAVGGAIGFTFTPTGIGVAVTVHCSCGSEKNITDYESW